MILDNDDEILARAETEHLRFWLRQSKADTLNYIRHVLQQGEIKHDT